MGTWETVTAEKAFITDLGENSQNQQQACRFAVWLPEKNERKHRIAEVGNNLENLKQKYKVTTEYIFLVSDVVC